jgi:hypothetical protein
VNQLKSGTSWHVIGRWLHSEWSRFAQPARGIEVKLRTRRVRDRKLLRASALATAADRARRELDAGQPPSAREHLADPARECFDRERLGDDLGAGLERPIAHRRVVRVTRDEQDF